MEEKLETLIAQKRSNNRPPEKYSAFIRKMRIALPLLALGIVALVFSWNSFQSSSLETPQTPQNTSNSGNNAPEMGKNELINPRFESVDQDNQPFMVTAETALQGSSEDDLLVLQKTLGDIVMNNGNWIAVSADQADYAQTAQTMLLKNNVQLFTNDGFTMKTELLDVNIKDGLTNTDQYVEISGPSGTIDAQGLNINSQTEHIVFKGPAKLVLFEDGKQNFGDLMP